MVRSPHVWSGRHRGGERQAGTVPRTLVGSVAAAVLVLGTIALLPGDPDLPAEAVLNPSARTNLSNWRTSSADPRTSLRRVSVDDGPGGTGTTAVEVRRTGNGDSSHALATLHDPERFLREGNTYRLQAYVRDRRPSGRSIGVLLADIDHGPGSPIAQRYERLSDRSWHLLRRTFVAKADGEPDTALFLDLPSRGPMSVQVTGASLRRATPSRPSRPPRPSGPPTTKLTFAGPRGAPPNPRVWVHEVGGNGWGAHERQTYTARTANARLDGRGRLSVIARAEKLTGGDGFTRSYTSARLRTNLAVQPGSYVEAKLVAPVGRGLAPAFWLIGANFDRVGWPACGELDVMETSQSRPGSIRQTIHLSSLTHPSRDRPYGDQVAAGRTTMSRGADRTMHRYGVYFDDSTVQFFVDGRRRLSLTRREAIESGRAWPFGRPQRILLNVAISGPTNPATLPATMTVSSISVWAHGVPFDR